MKPSPQDLAALCRDLRAAGVPVDVRHELRLGEVFGRAGPVSGERARRLVQAVVLADPAHRADVEDALDGWLPTVADTTPPSAPVLEVAAVPGGAPPRREAPPGQRLPWDKVLGGLLAALALVGVVLLAIPHEDSPPPVVDPPPPVAQDLGVDGAVPTPTGSYAVPRVWTEPAQEVDWSPWFLFGIGLLGLLAVGPQARRWQVFPQALPPAGGEPPAPPPRPEVTPALASWTDPGDRRAMVWGVDHFETEDPSARLDLRGSIRATARAALRPVVRYRRRRQPRTVWLWVDGLADPQAHEVAQQVHADLRRANLDARLAWTFGSPERVTLADHDQTELPSDGLDTPPDGAIVVWFTDGHGLSHVDDDTERRRAVRALRAWPRLAIVQCGGAAQGGGDLKAHARSSGAVILTPDRVAGWIGRGVSPRKAGVDLTVWRAAAALSPTPVDEATLLSLGARLGYPTPRALLDGVLADAQTVGPRVTWPAPLRARWLTWLGQQPELGEVLAFWLAHHAAPSADDGRTARARAVDRALLTLWHDPERASWDLAQDPAQGDRVREALRHLTPRDGQPDAPETTARLPWVWAALGAEARVRLSALGLAGVPGGLRPVRPGRQWFGLGLSAALVALGLSLGVAQWLTAPDLAPREISARPAGAALVQADGGWAVGLRQGHGQVTKVGRSERLVVDWSGRRGPCAEPFGDNGAVWRCLDGAPAAAPDDARWPDQMLVAISAEPTDPAARRLARRILRWGAADVVVLRHWPWVERATESGVPLLDWDRFLRQPGRRDRVQAVVVQPRSCDGTFNAPTCVAGDFDQLAAAIGPRVRPFAEVWSGRSAPTAVLRGRAEDAAAGKGLARLEITVINPPLGAAPSIRLDGTELARGVRFAGDIAPGRHTLTVHEGGEQVFEQALDVAAGEQRQVDVRLPERAEGAQTVYFDDDSSAVRKDQAAKLDAAAVRLAQDPSLRLRLEGHTDERGTEEKNLSIGELLAKAVRKALIDRGVDGARITTMSYGEDRPVDAGHSEAAWARNRRVELVFEVAEAPPGQRSAQGPDPEALPEWIPPGPDCTPAVDAQVKALVVPAGIVEMCFGAGGPGPRPDVRCDFDYRVGGGALQVIPRRGGQPNAAHCQCIADNARALKAPDGLGPCNGTFKVRWTLPAADRVPPGGVAIDRVPSASPTPATVWLDGDRLRFKGSLEFRTNKATLETKALPTVKRLAEFLNAHPELALVEVANHTDSSGKARFNLDLTGSRAEALVAALEQAGVAADRLVALGYGDNRPLVPNTTAANRALNVRTELRVLKRKAVGPR